MSGKSKLYRQLFTSTFSVSAFTLGGGYVIVPLMRKKFVEQYGWLEDDEMLDMTALAQSAPGPIAINTAILVGYRMAGVIGAFITVFGTVLPPLVIISVISLFYEAFRASQVVGTVLHGMQAGVAAVIADVVLGMGGSVLKAGSPLHTGIMAAAFIAAAWFHVNVAVIILSCGALGIALSLAQRRKGEG